jgi:hypothetical protein
MRTKQAIGASIAAAGAVAGAVALPAPPAAADHGTSYCGHGTSGVYYHTVNGRSVAWRAVYLSARNTVSAHIHKYMSQARVNGPDRQYWVDSHTYERTCNVAH